MRLSCSCCQRTYFRIFSSSSPTVLTQYPCAQKCRPQYRRFIFSCRLNTWIALFPFKYPTTSDTEYLGGKLKTKCTWSDWTFFSKISTFFHLHKDSKLSSTVRRTPFSSTLYLYFGHQTKWYLHSQTECANFLKRFIYASLSFSGSSTL